MLIKEVCELCGLTKKAVEYYESKGLLKPAVLENGYRSYGENEISVLKEITVLRGCGISIPDIREILQSTSKAAVLEKHRYAAVLREERIAEVRSRIDSLIEDYDIEREFRSLERGSDYVMTIKEKLALVFPGNYGVFLSVHFGRFLNEAADTDEKRAACSAVIQYLDSIELYLSPEVTEFMEMYAEAFSEKNNAAELQAQISGKIINAAEDPDSFIEQNEAEIKKYLDYKTSEEFKSSPAGQMQKSLLDFQKASGYQEIFISNMKLLSASYAEYSLMLERANEKFIQRFPVSKDIYK